MCVYLNVLQPRVLHIDYKKALLTVVVLVLAGKMMILLEVLVSKCWPAKPSGILRSVFFTLAVFPGVQVCNRYLLLCFILS